MTKVRWSPTAVLMALAIGACAAGTGGADAGSANFISSAEVEQVESRVSTAYDLVQRLHPEWLRVRGAVSNTSADPIVIYLDNARVGGPRALRGIGVSRIESVRFLGARRATTRFGTGHTSGAIIVSTR